MFRPNTTGMLSRRTTKNQYAEWVFADPVEVACGVVDTVRKLLKTPVRADSSASRGAAEEATAVYKILFLPDVGIRTNDHFQIDGLTLRATAVTPRRSVLGVLDHHEVDFDIWPTS